MWHGGKPDRSPFDFPRGFRKPGRCIGRGMSPQQLEALPQKLYLANIIEEASAALQEA